MIGGKKVLGLIPARGGSKGVPRKNVRIAAGKPLIAWTIEAARNSRYLDRVVLSSDDPEIISVAESYGCEAPFVRPATLAEDGTPAMDVILNALEQLPGYDYLALLQPTSPLRTAEDIDAAIEQCVRQGVPVVVSVTEAEQNPAWMFRLDGAARLEPVVPSHMQTPRRQDLPPVYVLNGAVYVANVQWLVSNRTFLSEETRGYVMPASRSLDIDTERDLVIFNLIKQDSANGKIQGSARS